MAPPLNSTHVDAVDAVAGEERRQVAGDGGVGGVGQAELVQAAAAAARTFLAAGGGKEAVEQHLLQLGRG